MTSSFDFQNSSSVQIETAINQRLHRMRLSLNITREALAEQAGLSVKTISNLESGKGVSFNSIIRVLKAFGIQGNLEVLVPDLTISPMELLETQGKLRKRASGSKKKPSPAWKWQWKE